jgi:hypothetical protein
MHAFEICREQKSELFDRDEPFFSSREVRMRRDEGIYTRTGSDSSQPWSIARRKALT